MKNIKFAIWLVLMCMITGCSSDIEKVNEIPSDSMEKVQESTESAVGEEVFQKEYFRIDYHVGDGRKKITDSQKIEEIKGLLKELTLEEELESTNIEGFIVLELVGEDGTVTVAVATEQIIIDGYIYVIDKDITEELNNILY